MARRRPEKTVTIDLVEPLWPCPRCVRECAVDRVFQRTVRDIGNTRYAHNVRLRYSQHRCGVCDRYFSVDLERICPRKCLYTNRVIPYAVHLLIDLGLSFRSAEDRLWKEFSVHAPFGTIHNWLERYHSEWQSRVPVARERIQAAIDHRLENARLSLEQNATPEEAGRYLSVKKTAAWYQAKITSEEDLLSVRALMGGGLVFPDEEVTAWLRIVRLRVTLSRSKPHRPARGYIKGWDCFEGLGYR